MSRLVTRWAKCRARLVRTGGSVPIFDADGPARGVFGEPDALPRPDVGYTTSQALLINRVQFRGDEHEQHDHRVASRFHPYGVITFTLQETFFAVRIL